MGALSFSTSTPLLVFFHQDFFAGWPVPNGMAGGPSAIDSLHSVSRATGAALFPVAPFVFTRDAALFVPISDCLYPKRTASREPWRFSNAAHCTHT